MTTIKSELLLGSKNRVTRDTLYTFRLTVPRIVLSELLTHRTFSRNTSSTRAIPTLKMIKAVFSNMFVPKYIGAAQKGMQAGAELSGWRRTAAETVWKLSGYISASMAYVLFKLGVAKQISGRIVEPYSWVTQILSGTDVENFFALRNHDAAEPHLHELAAQMQAQVNEAADTFKWMEDRDQNLWIGGCGPIRHLRLLEPGEWHLPFADGFDDLTLDGAKKVSAARCARTSYTLIESGRISAVGEDLALCDRLLTGGHLSPFEHQAQALTKSVYSGNFRSFKQYRKDLPNEAGGDQRYEEAPIPELVKAGVISVNTARAALDIQEGGVVLTAEEREHVSKLLAGYLVGPAAVPAIRKIRGY